LEARLQDNPNLLEDIDSVTVTLRDMKEQLAVASKDLKASTKSRDDLQAQLSEKTETARGLQNQVDSLMDFQQTTTASVFVVNSLVGALKNELSISLKRLSDPSATGDSDSAVDVSEDGKLEDGEIIPELESIRQDLVANRMLAAEVGACLHQKNAEASQLKASLQVSEESVRALTAQSTELQETLDKMRSQSSDELSASAKERDVLVARSLALAERVQALEGELSSAQDENSLLINENKKLNDLMHGLKSENAQLQTAVESKKSELTSQSTLMTEQLQRLQQDLQRVEAVNEALASQKSDVESSLDNLKSQSSQDQTAAQAAQRILASEISDLKRQLDKAASVSSGLEEAGKRGEEALAAANAEIASLLQVKDDHERLTARFKAGEDSMLALQEKCAALEASLADKESKEAELALSLGALNAHSSALEDSNMKFSSELSKLRGELKDSQTQCTAAEQRVEELNISIAVTKQKFATEAESLKAAKTQAESDKQRAVEQLEQMECKLHESQSKYDGLSLELNQARTQVHNYDRTNRALRQDLDRAESDHRDVLRSLQIEVEEGRSREESLEVKVEHLTKKLEEGLYRAMEKKYSRLVIEYESLKNKYDDLRGHFTHEVCLSDLVKNVEACRGDVSRRRDRWKLPLTTTVEKWIRFSEQEVVFVISVHLKDTSAAAFNTMGGNHAYAEYQPLLDANSSGK
jgi:chromosome segregation ATPase